MNEKALAMALMANHTYTQTVRSYKIATHYLQPPIVAELQQCLRWRHGGFPVDLAFLFMESLQEIIKQDQGEIEAIILNPTDSGAERAKVIEQESEMAVYFMEALADGRA